MTRRGRNAFVVLGVVPALIVSGFVALAPAPVAAQEATASPSASIIPMLVVDLLDTDLGYVDILGLGIALDGDNLVLTMRLTEPVPMDRSPSEERLDYAFVLDTGVSHWSVSSSNGQAGTMLGVVSDMDTGTSVDLLPGAVMLDGSLLTIAVPISVLGDPAEVTICAMARSSDAEGQTIAEDVAPDQTSGSCFPTEGAALASPASSPGVTSIEDAPIAVGD